MPLLVCMRIFKFIKKKKKKKGGGDGQKEDLYKFREVFENFGQLILYG